MFACRIKIHSITKMSSFYLFYNKYSHLLNDINMTLLIMLYEKRFKLLQSIRKKVAIIIYEKIFKNKNAWDELI